MMGPHSTHFKLHLVEKVVQRGELAQYTFHLVERIAQSGELAQYSTSPCRGLRRVVSSHSTHFTL